MRPFQRERSPFQKRIADVQVMSKNNPARKRILTKLTNADDEDGPSTVRIIADPTLTSGISTFIVDDMIGWPDELSFDGAALQVTMPEGANQFSLSATDGDDIQIWGVAVWNPPMDTVAVPVFPGEWGWDGLPDSSLDFEALALVLNGDINEIVFDDFRDFLESFSESYLKVY